MRFSQPLSLSAGTAMLEQARAETLADSAEVRPHLRFPMNSRRAEFQNSMMNKL